MPGPPFRTWSSEVGRPGLRLQGVGGPGAREVWAVEAGPFPCVCSGLPLGKRPTPTAPWDQPSSASPACTGLRAGRCQRGGLGAQGSPLLGPGAMEIQGPAWGGGLGLAKSPSARTQEVAFQLAQNWIRTNFDVYSQRSAMYEKVSSTIPPGAPPPSEGSSDSIRPRAAQPGQWRHPVATSGHCRGRGCVQNCFSSRAGLVGVGPVPDLSPDLLSSV